MSSDYRNLFRIFAVATLLMGIMMSVAHAEDDDDDDDEQAPVVRNVQWQNECGACHVAYPPRLLPAESWRAVMTGLDKHFGSDASLDAATAREIGAFLERNAGSSRYATTGKPVLRITETRWFVREHDEVPARVWKNPKVRSAANCSACHTQAESGNYSEHNIRIPK
ncbi:diheme cytochrome c [Sideroxydans lithotrophicus]|uniref:Diheme cytochrome c n=1 Tax=Sideroxydans lithotrophicus (strain ES-1) TaxID=580332 RepID=D5CQL6_SIDLE|nr:diheme cytochrome c [Sideroxydans lithotrophicus]ADE11252.1 Diheme cytochrome c [Sideroxydans lithotrophicus ES-1]